ncbi:hypothetical protein HUG15_18240 [Salicibibacter cibarius]|uniref:Septation ring formation regulator EzrA n=1 Tax=Salicibibacter cibarius TaxID=2743000 RepID=A0A7T7CCT5_9BACI|nr:septation ring formation regulator EzrA [Salicibibacter cibarius]QQK77324.1 hypothetical protein HUG15_18240 [Salicibibacter cibarius]
MVYVFIGIVVAIALVVAYGVFNRRQIYQSVDNLDQRKGQMMSEPVADEISRVKGLTISGETEEKFERWRETWDEIADERLPEMEMYLFDIEEIANKYQFRRAKEKLVEADHHLNAIEEDISTIRQEVEQLVNSEEKNREEIEKVTEKYKEVRSLLSRQWRSLGEAGPLLEEKVKQCREELEAYDEETKSGNYMRAREHLLFLQETLEEIHDQIENVPKFLGEIDRGIPEQARELRSDIREMEENAFSFEHFTVYEDLDEIDATLIYLKENVSALELTDVEEKLEQIKETLAQNVALLEREKEAKHEVENGLASLKVRHEALINLLSDLEDERSGVEINYQLPEEDKSKIESIQKEVADVGKEERAFEDLHANQKQSYADLREKLENLNLRMGEIEDSINESLERLQEIRGDETRAIELLKELRVWMMETQFKLQKSQLPAVPEILVDHLDYAGKELEKATAMLETTPLNMKVIQEALEQSRQGIEQASHTLNETIDQANWAERLLQFGNRYRNQFAELPPILNEAEWQFRNGYYEDAINDTARALERLVPYAFSTLQTEWDKRSQRQMALDSVK